MLWTPIWDLNDEEYLFHWKHIIKSERISIKYSIYRNHFRRNYITAAESWCWVWLATTPKPLEKGFCWCVFNLDRLNAL